MTVIELRDTDVSVIEIALKYNFSDQSTFGAPLAYRKNPKPLPLVCKKMLLKPFENNEGRFAMSNISKPYVRVEYIPAHKYLGVYKRSMTKYGEIYLGHDCDPVCGIISSFKDSDPVGRTR